MKRTVQRKTSTTGMDARRGDAMEPRFSGVLLSNQLVSYCGTNSDEESCRKARDSVRMIMTRKYQ